MSITAQPSDGPVRPGPFVGKVAIVTGASKGIGRAIALRLAAGGATLVLTARTQATLVLVAGEVADIGATASIVPVDLRHPEAPDAVVAHALAQHGAIDIVVNNAGAARAGSFVDFTDADWEDAFALKFFGAVRLSRAAWPELHRRHGAILNIIGIAGRTPNAEATVSGSVNGAFLTFTKALADLGIRDGVRVNGINPGLTRTDRFQPLLQRLKQEFGDDEQVAIAQLLRRNNITRVGRVEDIANLAAFMLSAEGEWLQGAFIDMDGGQTKSI